MSRAAACCSNSRKVGNTSVFRTKKLARAVASSEKAMTVRVLARIFMVVATWAAPSRRPAAVPSAGALRASERGADRKDGARLAHVGAGEAIALTEAGVGVGDAEGDLIDLQRQADPPVLVVIDAVGGVVLDPLMAGRRLEGERRRPDRLLPAAAGKQVVG